MEKRQTESMTGTPPDDDVESPSFSRYRDGTTPRIGGEAASCVRGSRVKGGVTSTSRGSSHKESSCRFPVGTVAVENLLSSRKPDNVS
jgi:hypothetical protein